MSAIDVFSRAQNPRADGPIGRVIAGLRRYKSYRRTLIELDNLTDRELTDLGLSRHQIRSVAYREAYRR